MVLQKKFNMISVLIYSILLAFNASHSSNYAADDWIFVKNDNGMQLYHRNVAGFTDKELKVVFPINANINKVKDYLYTPENLVNWMANCTFSKSEAVHSNHKFYYAIYEAPWPISDRDDYGKVTLLKHTSRELKLTFNSVPDGKPLNKEYVRVPYSKGQVHLYYDNVGQLIMDYQILVNRGGTLPDYIREYLENSSPLLTAKRLKGQLESI